MKLAVVAYPQLDPETAASIESFRASHDPNAHRISAHFTIVFPAEADAAAVAEEVRRVAASSAPIAFSLARVGALPGIDGRCYVVLEPAEGRAAIETIHDRLYAGVLADQLRRDVDYVPHVTVASGEDAEGCGRLADDLRAAWRPAAGRIAELVLLDLDEDPFRPVEVFGLRAEDEISGPFYHGTKADLKPGDLICPGYRSNYGHLGERTSPWVYMTATLSPLGAELARGEGPGRLYIVEPTGPFVDDPDLTDKKFPGNPTKSYRSRYPLRVVGEVTDWEPHPPEQIQAMLDGQARLYVMQAERIARIPSASDFDEVYAQADKLAHEWSEAPEYVGSMHLMLIRGAEVEVYSAVSYRSSGETRTFELPRSIKAHPGWLPGEMPLSGRITDVDEWHDGWAAVIESCLTEIGLSVETRIWIAVDADHDTLRFRVDADGPERSWQRNLQLSGGVLADAEHGDIWDFRNEPASS